MTALQSAGDVAAPAAPPVEAEPEGAPLGSRYLGALGLTAIALAAVVGALIVTSTPSLGVVLGACLVLLLSASGLYAASRRPNERLGSMVSRLSALLALVLLAHTLVAEHTALARSVPAFMTRAALFVEPVAGGIAPVVAMHLLLSLPDGTCRLRRSVLTAGYLAGTVLGLLVWLGRPTLHLWPIWVEIGVLLAFGVAGSSRRYAVARSVERRRMQWFAWATVVAIGLLAVAVAARLLWGWPTKPALVLAAALAPFVAAVALASSHRLADQVEPLLLRTCGLVGAVVLAAVVYLVIFVGYGPSLNGGERLVLGLSVLASALTVVGSRPLRRAIARRAAVLMHGDRREASTVLHTFGSRLSREVPMDELLLQVAETLQTSLDLDGAEIWTGSDGRLERMISIPAAEPATIVLSPEEEAVVGRAGVSGRAWIEVWLPSLLAEREKVPVRVAPATHSGHVLGLIVAVGHAGGDQFSAEDDSMMSELARQIGVALHNVALDSALQASLDEVRRQAEELQASRARIVAASDAARRQIERNLHDGAQQHLVALAVNLRLARRLAETDPSASGELLDQLGEGLNDAVRELRTLAHGIYPPLLVDRGVEEALRSAAGRAVLPTEIETSGVGRYSPEQEAAVYFCCMEALQNASKHAGEGATVTIRVWEESGGLLFKVSDTGVGFDMATFRRDGAGFVNMSDRVGAIGGTVRVHSTPGHGTTVSGRLPITR